MCIDFLFVMATVVPLPYCKLWEENGVDQIYKGDGVGELDGDDEIDDGDDDDDDDGRTHFQVMSSGGRQLPGYRQRCTVDLKQKIMA